VSWPLEGEKSLDLDEIQGHVLIGFGGAPQALGAYTAADPAAAARTAGRWAQMVTSTRRLLPRMGRPAREVVGGLAFRVETGPWVALALSRRVLEAAGRPVDFDDPWFAAPSMPHVSGLHDPLPADGGARGTDWVVGRPDRPVDVLLVVAAGTVAAAEEVVGWFSGQARRWLDGEPFVERLLPMKGSKEHFGFRDGISQPALLGLRDDGSLFDGRRAEDDGGPPRTTNAQDLVWPGEFVFGYRTPVEGDPRVAGPEARPAGDAAAAFARNGSMLVYRRLAQDVPAFRAFCAKWADERVDDVAGLTPETLADLIVGRRPTGLPLSAPPDADIKDPAAVNAFDFRHDAMDQACPLSAHIRKVNPRAGPKDKQLRRILRRGAPFGSVYVEREAPPPGGRGLVFLAYMTNAREQFGVLATDWMNNANAPAGRGGHDMLVGQVSASGSRVFDLRRDPPAAEITAGPGETWVHMTGGAFLFAPSIGALRALAEIEQEGVRAVEAGPQPEDLEKALKQYAIYERPDDHPESYVLREWLILPGQTLPGDSHKVATLEAARALLPAGVSKVSEGPEPDAPKLVEVWM
jgi:deferrochelatase/peroxidase EfeB